MKEIGVNSVEAVKPKSVNLALETVLQFDKKDQSADVEVLNRVQNFLDNIKDAMTSSKAIRRRSNTKDLKFTDFLLEAAEALNSYDDDDLEEFFTVLDDQSRKYNYKGCKFYELVENKDVRRYMSNKLEQAKDTSVRTMRRYLKDVVKVIESNDYGSRRGLVKLVNSLYDGASDKLDNVVESLRSYQSRSNESTMNLDDIVSDGVKKLFFDHYTNLNNNARQQLKKEITNYWLSSQYNGENHKKDQQGSDKDFKEEQDYKSKLRVIDVPSKFKNQILNKKDRIKNKGGKGSLSYKKDKRNKSKKPSPKMDIDFMNFKKTTRDNPLVASEEDNTKNYKMIYGHTQGLKSEDVSNVHEVKKATDQKKSYEVITPSKSSDGESGDGTGSINTSEESEDEKGISIDFLNEQYLSTHNKNRAMKKHKKEKIGHITYDVERRIKMKAHDYSDEDITSKDSETAETSDSNDEDTISIEPVREDFGEVGIVIGGQNIQDTHSIVESTPRILKRKGKDTATNYDGDSNRPKFTKKLRDRQKLRHKSIRKIKNKKGTSVSDADNETTLKASKIIENKDSAFATSDEGITIETFENSKESENRYTRVRKADEPTTASKNNVQKRIHNLEKQMEDVKEQMKFVLSDKSNHTAADTQTNAKNATSNKEADAFGENAQDDPGIKTVENVEIRVYSKSLRKTDTKMTKTLINDDITTTALDYETDMEAKPSRTTVQQTNDETKYNIYPKFRNDLHFDNEKIQESNESDTVIINTSKNHETTEVLKEQKTTATGIFNDTTWNTTTASIFTTTEEAVTALGYDGEKNDEHSVVSTMDGEESKGIGSNNDTQEDNAQKITTVVDLRKQLKESDVVEVNVTDEGENKMLRQTQNIKGIGDLKLPHVPLYQDGKVNDPLNDVNLDTDY